MHSVEQIIPDVSLATQNLWKAFLNVDEDVVGAMTKLGTIPTLSDKTMKAIEKLLCILNVPKTSLSTVKDVRTELLRAHHQVTVWDNDIVGNPDIASPENYGWEKHDKKWLPVMTKLPRAPEAVIHLVKCAVRNNANRASAAKMGCHAQTSVLVMMRRISPTTIFLAK